MRSKIKGEPMSAPTTPLPVRIVVIAGEHSGDALGAKLMAELNRRLPDQIAYTGVGGALMEREGLTSLFPLADITVMGVFAILKQLPTLWRRGGEATAAAVAAQPNVVVIIDAPEFTHRVAKRIRKRLLNVPIIDYVSPTVWAWRPGRAKAMTPYVDHVLALLPFEPAVHRDLGGPQCTYVGHPLLEKLAWIDGLDPDTSLLAEGLAQSDQLLVVLPGSRRSEVERLMGVFGEAMGLLTARQPGVRVVIPAMPNVRPLIEARLAQWPKGSDGKIVGHPRVVAGDQETLKFSIFKAARAALAASGTVTLELALARTPMVVAYKVDLALSLARRLIMAKTCVLPNLITGDRAIPEFLQEDCTAENLAVALDAAMREGPSRAAQMMELTRVPEQLALSGGRTPSAAAADVVMATLGLSTAASTSNE
jgi:lipid-A-disaccharide synthase